ncbi:MAG: Sialic acid TRAP transporter permease protein SiaT [Smithella sp. PtaU1.Bin162]|nr:MAG: Sialic acid TRAP transporter permease protein SiaT [Smithella sp. PtaU1.Bin162]
MTKNNMVEVEEKLNVKKHRVLTGPVRWIFMAFTIIAVLAAIFVNFYLSVGGWTFPATGYLFFLLAFFIPLVFIVYPHRKGAATKKIPWFDYLLAALSLISALFLCYHANDILYKGWEVMAPLHARIMALIILITVIESARRTGGLVFCCVVLVFALYPLFANHMPLFLQGKSFGFWRTVAYHGMGPESIIGIPLTVVGNLLIGFMIFAVVLMHTGAGKFFLDFALALLGPLRGGAAKVSIVSSALMGSISGSVISNVLGTGSVTIPAMKKTGFSPRFAGAVEACASTGAVVMPPVMGATAFVMAQVLQVPYVTIIIAALVPSFLYFFCLFIQVDAYAARNGIIGTPRAECPKFGAVMKEGWFYLAAIALLMFIVVVLWREGQAAWITTLVLLGMTMIKKATRLTWAKFLDLIEAIGKFMAEITSILAACGLIIGSMGITGIAHSFSGEIVSFAGGNMYLLLLLGAFASFILGMGMTITACYIFLAIVLAPALINIGLNPLAVHLFVMYWGMASFITPPVALGSFAAASLSGASPMATGVQSMRLGIATYIVPFFFVLNPAIILHGSLWAIISTIATCTVGLWIIASSLEGYMIGIGKLPLWSRPFLFVSGLMLGYPGWKTDLAGFVIFLALLLLVVLARRFSQVPRTS